MTHDELRRLAEAATPGPWSSSGSQVWGYDGNLVAAVRDHSELVDRPDAEFIAAVDPQTILGLLDEIERLRLSQDYTPEGVDMVMQQLHDVRAERDALRARIKAALSINTGDNRRLYGNDFEAGMAKALWLVKCALDGDTDD